ncbi:DUF6443 domain-containing protein [Pedobacter sp. 22163]|uniref:DUF6443 domain-containing protein n=1 Tax=Pedobacter sp. 22163 TaxID=3453883 RepID=UPI003F869E97
MKSIDLSVPGVSGYLRSILSVFFLFTFFSTVALAQSGTVYGPYVIPVNACGPTSFSDFRNNYGYPNNFGQSSPEVCYSFSIAQATNVSVSLCGSDFDTYLHILDQNGSVLYTNDDNGILCSGSTRSSLSQILQAGTYTIVTEGYSSYTGNIALDVQIQGGGAASPGSGMAGAINAGTFSSTGSFTDTRSNAASCLGNTLGQQSNDIFYKFVLTGTFDVELLHCGSGFDTYLHLLDQWGTEITYNDDSSSGPCPGSQAYIKTTLAAGTYYVASEGYSSNTGNIVTTINISSGGSSQLPVVSYTSPSSLGLGIPVSLSPTNSGGAVSAVATASTLAGSGNTGSANGSGSAASFYNPLNTAVDAQRNVYVADGDNHMIRKISPLGVVSTLAGAGYPGYADGQGTSALFQHPSAIAVDASGTVYVSDQQNHRIRKISPTGTVSTLAGSGSAGFSDGNGTGASFSSPIGLALDASGNLYVADYGNHRIRKITPGGTVSTFAGTGGAGNVNGAGLSSSFRNPMGLSFDVSGNLYVADRLNHSIRKITPSGTVSTLAGNGTAGFVNGAGSGASFNYPNGVAVDASGNVFVADQQNHSIRKVSGSGAVTTLAGNGSAGTVNGNGPVIRFNSPYGLSIDAGGSLYVAESSGQVIRKVGTGAYSVSPALPAGLSIDAVTGVISGTPIVLSTMTAYTVTVNGSSGSSTATVMLEVASVGACVTPSADQNYIITYTPRMPNMTTPASVVAMSCYKDAVQTSIQYLDGLGRPSQNVQVMGSPTGMDIVQPITYDGFGRQDRKYLPYPSQSNGGGFRTDATSPGYGVFNYYFQYSAGVSGQQLGDARVIIPTPFGQSVYEPSPLNRVMEQGFPGDPWQPVTGSNTGHTVKTENGANGINEVRLWEFNQNGNGAAHNNNYYPAKRLYKTTSKDENWTGGKTGITEEFKDFDGKMVLKQTWKDENTALSTYYIYDDFGNLRYVLPPAVNDGGQSVVNNFTEADDVCKYFIYCYHYDGRKRVVEKKIPGKGWESIVYNDLDQVVYSQDANQYNLHQWSWTKYDAFGKVLITGIEKNNYLSRTVLQNDYINVMEAPIWEERTGQRPDGYTARTHPMAGEENANIEFHVVSYFDDYNFPGGGTFGFAQASPMTRGLLTGSKVKILDSPTSLLDINFYDNKGQVVKSSGQNHLGGEDHVSNTYSFTGEILSSTRQHHKAGGPTTAVYNEYEYDHMDRARKTFHRIGDDLSKRVLLSEVLYNEIGQNKSKQVNNGLNTNNYEYNERGWLRKSSSTGFEFVLNYNIGNAGSFNGNVSEQLWTTSGSMLQGYTYVYDKLNRLNHGYSSTGNNEKDIAYDAMGSILSLTRNTNDILNYIYEGNRLKTVSGAVSRIYTYDDNGNALSDGVNGFIYNMLDLPVQVNGINTATYTYDATGKKLKRVTTGGGTTDYLSGIQYKDGIIDFIETDEGLAKRISDTEYRYQYNLKDHLGNVRYTFDSNGNKIQSDDFYPFGKSFNSFVSGEKNNYLYNGKELQEGLAQYDYGARFYDPEIGRWNSIDPLSEKTFSISPFAYTDNNPVNNIDPNGMETYYGDAARIMYQQLRATGGGQDAEHVSDLGEDPPKKKPGYFTAFYKKLGESNPFDKAGRTWEGWLSSGSTLGSDMWNAVSNTFWTTASLLDGNTYVNWYDGQKAYWSMSAADRGAADGAAFNAMAEGAITSAPLIYTGFGTKNVLNFELNGGYGQKIWRFEFMYKNPRAKGGTIFSYTSPKVNGFKFRLDYHVVKGVGKSLHYHTNFSNLTLGTHRSLSYKNFGKAVK